MTALPGEHGWSENALFNKTLIYVQKMEQHGTEDGEYGFWSSLSLEFLCRAAVAHCSPTLLADGKNWRNAHYALGQAPTAKKFVPKSAEMRELVEILAEIVPGFVESKGFCIEHISRRNAELHSGDLEFKDFPTSRWLPRYYLACKVLLEYCGKSLGDLFGSAENAEALIIASQDEAAKAVGQSISAHRVVWTEKGKDEKLALMSQSEVWASRERGHRVKCPVCESTGLLRGAPQGYVSTKVGDDEIIQKQTVIPSSFECIACGLKILGLAKLVASGLGNPFTETSTSTPADFFGLYTEQDLEEARNSQPIFDDDNNE